MYRYVPVKHQRRTGIDSQPLGSVFGTRCGMMDLPGGVEISCSDAVDECDGQIDGQTELPQHVAYDVYRAYMRCVAW